MTRRIFKANSRLFFSSAVTFLMSSLQLGHFATLLERIATGRNLRFEIVGQDENGHLQNWNSLKPT